TGLDDQSGCRIDQSGLNGNGAEAAHAAQHQKTNPRELAKFALLIQIVLKPRFELELLDNFAELAALDEIEPRLERWQQFVGDDLARPDDAEIAEGLEISDAERVAALLQGKRAVVDVVTDFGRVPREGRFAVKLQCIIDVVRVAA